MSVLELYRQEAKVLYPVEVQIRKINEIRKRNRAGEQLTAEQYENALKPITSEIVKTQDILRELTNRQKTLPIDLVATLPESILKTPAAMSEPPTALYATHSSIDDFLNDEFASAVLLKHKLQHPEVSLEDLATVSKQLGGQKAKSSGSERKEIDKEIMVIRNYRKLLQAPQGTSQGTGIAFYEESKELLNRLNILIGQRIAGNDSVDIQNEALAILDKLLQEKMISNEDHKKLYDKIYSF